MERNVYIDKLQGLIAMLAVGEALGLAHDDRGAAGHIRPVPPIAWPTFAEAIRGSAAFRAMWAGQTDFPSDVRGIPGPVTTAFLDPMRRERLDGHGRDLLGAIDRAIHGLQKPRLSLMREIMNGVTTGSESTRAAIGLFGVILAAAFATVEGSKHVHYWFSETVRKRLPQWIAAEPNIVDPALLTHFRIEWQNMVTLAINLRRRPNAQYLSAMYADHQRRVVEDGVDAGDPALLVKYAGAHLTFTVSHFTRGLAVSGSGPGRTALLGALTGAWIGAFYGFERLKTFDTPDEPLAALFAASAEGVTRALGIDPAEVVHTHAGRL